MTMQRDGATRRYFTLAAMFVACTVGSVATPTLAATITVTSAAASGPNTLASALAATNANANADTINFNIAGAGPHVIIVPSLAITNPVTIDGYTQPGSSVNTAAFGSNAQIRIELRSTTSGVPTLTISNGNTTLRGLAFGGTGANVEAIRIDAPGSTIAVRGCFVGLHPDGTAGTVGTNGVRALQGTVTIGTTALADRNVISGNGRHGIIIRDNAVATIKNNIIGRAPNGTTARGNAFAGIDFEIGAANTIIGGSEANAGNVIGANTDGIQIIGSAGSGHTIERNAIFGNTDLGIDLGNSGIDVNDPGDIDEGPNRLHNAPVLFFARQHGSIVNVQMMLDTNFGEGARVIEYFANPTGVARTFREGARFIGVTVLDPGPSAQAPQQAQSLNVPADLVPPYTITATARSADGSTSEFSNPVEVIDGGTVITVTNADDSGAGSLRAAVIAANAQAGANTIAFNIPGAGVHSIMLESGLGTISAPVILDGYTQPGTQQNTSAIGTNAQLRIVLDGGVIGFPGLSLAGADNYLRGVVVQNFGAVGVFFNNSSGTQRGHVEGCFIGTDVTGMLDRGNTTGINPGGASSGHVIGGPDLHQRNVISGNLRAVGIVSGMTVQNNLLGVAADGISPLGNEDTAISSNEDVDVTIADNVIAFNGGSGIRVLSGQVDLRANAIFGNDDIGIDLANDGVTLNDINDADVGPNLRQNFPVIGARQDGSLTRLQIALDRPEGVDARLFRIDVFTNDACDASGHGPGQRHLHSASIATPTGAIESFTVQFFTDDPPALGQFITATATDSDGNTSEFSRCATLLDAEILFIDSFE